MNYFTISGRLHSKPRRLVLKNADYIRFVVTAPDFKKVNPGYANYCFIVTAKLGERLIRDYEPRMYVAVQGSVKTMWDDEGRQTIRLIVRTINIDGRKEMYA